MAVDTKTLIATIVSEVLHRLEQPAGPVALVLAPACDGLKREVQNRLGGNAVADFTVFGRIAGAAASKYAA